MLRLTFFAALCVLSIALPTPDVGVNDDDDLDVEGLIDMQAKADSVTEMNGSTQGALMPSSSSPEVVMGEAPVKMNMNDMVDSNTFQNMEGEVEATGVTHPEQAMKMPAPQGVTVASPKTVLATMNGNDAATVTTTNTPNLSKGAEVDFSMPGSQPPSGIMTAASNNMDRMADNDDDTPIPYQAVTAQSADANVANEESKMNGDVGVVEENENPEALMAVAITRMNDAEVVDNSENDGMPTALPSTYTDGDSTPSSMDMNQLNQPSSRSVSAGDEDEADDGDGAMNAGEMNGATGNDPQAMNGNAQLGPKQQQQQQQAASQDEPSAFGTMNFLKSKTVALPQKPVVAVAPPSPTKMTPVATTASPEMTASPDLTNQEEEVDTAMSGSEMEGTSSGGMNQQPEQGTVMPSVTTGQMKEPDTPQEQAEIDETVVAATSPEMNPPEMSSPTTTETAVVHKNTEQEMESKMNSPSTDGHEMGNIKHDSNPSLRKTLAGSEEGFMDKGDAAGDQFSNQMNTVTPGLDMMSTISAFVEEDSVTAGTRPTAPFYNQYAPQTSQPQPLVGSIGSMPTHPYGLPYFHKDPFMPLQTPYYHIPAFDNPQKNPALTPYYNPYVNPPPPVPPSVPAAPSFFPYHHPQHMIPPYFPYPPAPVIQPGPFPPYALPSHLAPGQLHPNAKLSKLPTKVSDDPF